MADQSKPTDFGALFAFLFFAFACGIYTGGWLSTHVDWSAVSAGLVASGSAPQ
ncbi:MAG: hypothetical protein JWN27_2896 [Candidatus Eremiobacteraeota bacterium]|nr:hypothetical protein [Candidatus Eremiobacteraeota bacterium]